VPRLHHVAQQVELSVFLLDLLLNRQILDAEAPVHFLHRRRGSKELLERLRVRLFSCVHGPLYVFYERIYFLNSFAHLGNQSR